MTTALMLYRDRWAVDDPVLDCAIEIVDRKADYDRCLDSLYAESEECTCIRIDVDLDDNRDCPRHDDQKRREIERVIAMVERRGWA